MRLARQGWVAPHCPALPLPVASFPHLSPCPQGGAWPGAASMALVSLLVEGVVGQALAAGPCPRCPYCPPALDPLLIPSNYYFL